MTIFTFLSSVSERPLLQNIPGASIKLVFRFLDGWTVKNDFFSGTAMDAMDAHYGGI